MTPRSVGRALAWVSTVNQAQGYCTGTLAALLRPADRPDELLGLTAGHVVSEDARARVDDGCALKNSAGTAVAGRLYNWLPYFGQDDRSVPMDAGLIQLAAQAVEPLAADMAWPLGWADPQPGEDLRVLARQHRLPARMVRMQDVVPMQAGPENLRYDLLDAALFDVQNLMPGDSGAAVWNLKDELVGVVSGFAPDDAGAVAVMTPIRRILAWAKADLVLRHDALRPEDRGAPAPALPVAAPAPLASAPRAAAVDAAAALTLARTMWGEARGERPPGMAAVGHVVLNRVLGARWWGYDVESVCRHDRQFSCWNADDPNLPKMLRVTTADPQFAEASDLAAGFVAIKADDPQRIRDDPTHGATHYFDRRMPTWPNWAAGRQPVADIGNHLFFKDVG